MHTTNLRKVGGSIMLAVPPVLLELLHLKAGAAVGITVADGRLVAEPQRRRPYSLEELLAQCRPSAGRNEEERAWDEARPAGRELL